MKKILLIVACLLLFVMVMHPVAAGECDGKPAGTACSDLDPTDCGIAQCDGNGFCNQHAVSEPNGHSCGISSHSECDNPDTCFRGNCEPNHESYGTPCTDLSPNDCQAAQCDWNGVCDQTATSEPNGHSCGSSSRTECDNPDSCHQGDCEPNHESYGTPCTDLDPTDCGVAQCDWNGVCDQHLKSESNGHSCGSSSRTECDNPDTCFRGDCESNYVPFGTSCGSPFTTACDNPDSCNGFGACLLNNVADGTTCGSAGQVCTYGECGTPPNVPEFPYVCVPATLIIGFIGVVLYLTRVH